MEILERIYILGVTLSFLESLPTEYIVLPRVSELE